MKKKIYCPANSWNCPYCTEEGECTLPNPDEECDDYYYAMGGDEKE